MANRLAGGVFDVTAYVLDVLAEATHGAAAGADKSPDG